MIVARKSPTPPQCILLLALDRGRSVRRTRQLVARTAGIDVDEGACP